MPPKNKKKRKFWRPKGRALDAKAMSEINQLLDAQPQQRDLLIEFLHLIQDQYGCLSKAHLLALSEWMNLSPVEVYEVATFYHHFNVVEASDGNGKLTLRICNSISCMMAESSALIQASEASDHIQNIKIEYVSCVGRCDQAPVAVLGQRAIPYATLELIEQAINLKQIQPEKIPDTFGSYRAQGGYDIYQSCLSGEITTEQVITHLEDSNLRGLGGAGFPAGRKWRILSEQKSPRWIAVNIDEGEPGTFKDKAILEHQPHALLEGLLIAAWVIKSEQCILYVRDEYPEVRQALFDALKALKAWDIFKLPKIQIRRGAGAYICGEESAMLESIEGKPGLPRQRPPFIAEVGLFGLPTLEHNAETLYWVPEILKKGVDWYVKQGTNGRTGLRRYSLSGRIKSPGVFLAPAGTSVNTLIEQYGGGMLDGHTLYGYLPGGASGGILPATLADEPLDFDTLQKHGCFIGSAAVIVFSEHDKARDIARNAMAFFAHESCGQCTPCRVGTHQAASMMSEQVWPLEKLEELACVMEDASICGLGQAAPNPMRCVVKYFAHEVS